MVHGRRVDVDNGNGLLTATLTGGVGAGFFIDLVANAKNGKDARTVEASPLGLAAGSTGTVAVHLDRHNGRDLFDVAVTGGPSGLAQLAPTAGGGQDEDVGRPADVVDAVNVETVSLV